VSQSTFSFGRAALVGVLLLCALLVGASSGGASGWPALPAAVRAQDDPVALAAGLRALNEMAAASAAALAAGDAVAAREAYAGFDDGWEAIEDGVRVRSRDDYRSIEAAMREVNSALRDPIDAALADQWLAELQNRVNSFVATLPTS
jgi:hypothetical protein